MGDLAEVARMNGWLDGEMAQGGLAPDVASDFKVCLNEAVTNVISYGFPDGAGADIRVEVRIGAGSASAEITDNGIPFNPLARPETVLAERIEDVQIGGLGIKLIRELSSVIAYERRGDRNILRFTCG